MYKQMVVFLVVVLIIYACVMALEENSLKDGIIQNLTQENAVLIEETAKLDSYASELESRRCQTTTSTSTTTTTVPTTTTTVCDACAPARNFDAIGKGNAIPEMYKEHPETRRINFCTENVIVNMTRGRTNGSHIVQQVEVECPGADRLAGIHQF